jgi:Domain of unknown function (DUF6456)
MKNDHQTEVSRKHGSTEASNPLLWLYRRKGKSGESIIGAAAFAAGEKLRSDLTFSGMLPNVTMNWSNAGGADRSHAGVKLNPTEAALAARQRVDLAMRAVGPEFAGLLMDLCGFCKGLEMIEMERGWPQRSGKVVARFALAALSRHYGLDDVARGRNSLPVRRWAAEDARPRMTDAPFVAQHQKALR